MQNFWLDFKNNTLSLFSVTDALLFLLAGIVLMIAAGRFGLLRRPNRWHAMAVKIYYLYVPLAFLLIGLSWSMVNTMETAFLKSCDNARESIVASSVDAAKAVWETVSSRFSADKTVSLKELCLTVSRDYVNRYSEHLDKARSFSILAPMVDVVQEGMASGMALAVEEILIKKVADGTRLEEHTIRTLWKIDVLKAMQDGLAVNVLRVQILEVTSQAHKHVRTLAVLLLLAPVLETAVSLFFMRRKKPEPAAG